MVASSHLSAASSRERSRFVFKLTQLTRIEAGGHDPLP